MNHDSMKYESSSGFTLIELMVTVIIVGILAAVAFPSYSRYMTQTRRSDAQIILTQIANRQEKHFAECNTYVTSMTNANTCAGGGLGFASAQSPDGHYQVTLTAGNLANDGVSTPTCAALTCGYSATATPVAGGRQVGDGKFMLNALGQKFWDRNNDGDYADAGENKWTK